MSLQPSASSNGDDEEVNLALEFEGLSISVCGSSSATVDFVRRISSSSPTLSVTSAPPSLSFSYIFFVPFASPVSASETRASIEASFPDYPVSCLRLASRLQWESSQYSREDRIRRAWKAGNWAGATIRGRVQSPNRTPTIDLGNRSYVVPRTPDIDSPQIFSTSAQFHRAVGDLAGTDTVCHGFPTKTEAEVYIAGSEQ